MKSCFKNFATKAVHAGEHPDEITGAHITPLYLTSTFTFTPEKMDRWISGDKEDIYFYGRMGNPTQTVLNEKIAELESAEACLVTSSGMAAVSMAVMSVVNSGDHIISSKQVYGGTYYLFSRTLPRFNIDVSFIENFIPEELEKAVKPNTKVLYFETMHNPCLDVFDFDAIVTWAKSRGILTIVDNTFTTPYLFKPIEHGIDVSLHSTTKYLNGHGDHIGGALIGTKAFIDNVNNSTYQDIGPVPSPFQCWLGIRGIKTLHLRMNAHCNNAIQLALWLEQNKNVVKVLYPGLKSHKDYQLAAKYFLNGFGGMLSFEIKGGYKEARLFLDNLKLAEYAVSLGTLDTLVQHPATMTHSKVPYAERVRVGITDNLIRVSVGVEGVEDIIDDFDAALRNLG